MKQKYIILTFLVINIVLFIICANFWYKETNELYEYENFKEEAIRDIRENPEEFKQRFNIAREEELTDELIDTIIDDVYYRSKYIGRYIFVIMASAPISLFGSIILFSPIYFIISTVKKYKKYRLSIDNFKENNGYYRDLLKEYNPLELSYNNNYDLDDNALIAMALYLEKKKILSFKDNQIAINNDNLDTVGELEKKFIDYLDISDKNQITISHANITKLTDDSCKKKNLLIMGNIPKKKLVLDILKAITCYVILVVIWKNISTILDLLPSTENVFLVFSLFGILILMLLFVIFYPFSIVMRYIILYYSISYKHSKRTNLGNEINYKLDGLKNFIRDFSSLDERSKEEIKIWDDYLIYSVLFGDNKKVYDEMKDKVKYTI